MQGGVKHVFTANPLAVKMTTRLASGALGASSDVCDVRDGHPARAFSPHRVQILSP